MVQLYSEQNLVQNKSTHHTVGEVDHGVGEASLDRDVRNASSNELGVLDSAGECLAAQQGQ